MYGVWEQSKRLKWFNISTDTSLEKQLGTIEAEHKVKHDVEEQMFYSFDEPEDFRDELAEVICNATELKEKLEHMRENGVDLHHAEDHQQDN